MEAGRDVLAVAPTMSAVEELQKVGFADAITVERLLQDPRIRDDVHGKVIILDEAGMVSARQMADLLRLAEDCSLRVVFSGDTKQIRSVEAGDALRILEKESRLKTVALAQVQRQTRKDYRDAIEELRRNPERGFAKLDAMGAVREVAISERAVAVADAYDAAAGQSRLVVCATHDEIDRVTDAIRERRKTRGEVGAGCSPDAPRFTQLDCGTESRLPELSGRADPRLSQSCEVHREKRHGGDRACRIQRSGGPMCGRHRTHHFKKASREF